MNNNIIPFDYDGENVRVVMDESGDPWWVAKDVCSILDIGWRGSETLNPLDDDEWGSEKLDTPGGPQSLAIVNEPGLYTLIIRSNKPEAKRFKRWITHEVLPSIRKTGQYTALKPEANPIEKMIQSHSGLRTGQRIRLLELAYRISGMDEARRTRLLGDFNSLCSAFGISIEEIHARSYRDQEALDNFFKECTVPAEHTTRVRAMDLYAAFARWWTRNISNQVPTQRWFGRLTKERFRSEKVGGRYWYFGLEFVEQSA